MSSELILIVDDSATQLEALRSLLEANGYAVTAARSGEEALTRLQEETHVAVLSDVVMPGMTGYELCSHIKGNFGEPPPVVLLTSLSDPRDIVRGVECGADSYVTKPYEPQHLLSRLTQAIENHRLRRDAHSSGPVAVSFLGETYEIRSDPAQILGLLLSSFEELIRTNTALQVSKRQAEAATRARDDVLATVSHDLRNPLGTIFTSAALLLDMDLPPDAHRRQLEIIRRSAERMTRLIQDLLDVARMEAGGFTIEARPESLRGIVLEARDLFVTLAEQKGVSLTSRMQAEDRTVVADRERILQVLSNLIGNALRFTPADGTITIEVEETSADRVTLSVRDTGTGIAAANLPRIFDRFWHGGKEGGSGLGLAIVKGIVEAHGSTIEVRSDSSGTVFSFDLRIADVAPPPPTA